MSEPLLVGKNSLTQCELLPALANPARLDHRRHGNRQNRHLADPGRKLFQKRCVGREIIRGALGSLFFGKKR